MSDFYDEDDNSPIEDYRNDLYGEYADDEIDDVLKEVEDLNIPDFEQHPLEAGEMEEAEVKNKKRVKK